MHNRYSGFEELEERGPDRDIDACETRQWPSFLPASAASFAALNDARDDDAQKGKFHTAMVSL